MEQVYLIMPPRQIRSVEHDRALIHALSGVGKINVNKVDNDSVFTVYIQLIPENTFHSELSEV